jgi:hypothetical protein
VAKSGNRRPAPSPRSFRQACSRFYQNMRKPNWTSRNVLAFMGIARNADFMKIVGDKATTRAARPFMKGQPALAGSGVDAKKFRAIRSVHG